LIPYEFYEKCVINHDNIDATLDIVTQLPQLNRNVLMYFIRFLQVLITQRSTNCRIIIIIIIIIIILIKCSCNSDITMSLSVQTCELTATDL